jgi:hypothetical protein
MSKEAIKYLRENKDKYSRDNLVNALVENQYSDEDIKESLREVYGDESESKEEGNSDLLNFRDRKKYFSKKDKVIDFLLGFFAPVLLIILLSFSLQLLGFFSSLVLIIISSVFVFIKRRWIFYGIATWFLTTIIIFLIILYIVFNNLSF